VRRRSRRYHDRLSLLDGPAILEAQERRHVNRLPLAGGLTRFAMKRRTLLASPSLLLAPFLGACGASPAPVIGVVPKGSSSSFWQPVHAGALAAGQDLGAEIVWEAPAEETDISRQIEIVRGLIDRRVDGIVLAPSDRSSLAPVVEQAAAAGIPLAIFDSGIATERYLCCVATDNRAAGRLAAETVVGLLEGKGQVGMVRHMPGSESTEARESGFAEALTERLPEVRIVASEYCMSFRAQALAVAKEMLKARPGIRALFGSSEAATLGAMRGIQAAGRDGKVKLVGFDAAFGLLHGLRTGHVDALVVQDPFYIGYAAVKAVVQQLSGVEPPRTVQSPARLVTARNLDDPEVQKLLDPSSAFR
jgi:ribose transport system substrate-binding protein